MKFLEEQLDKLQFKSPLIHSDTQTDEVIISESPEYSSIFTDLTSKTEALEVETEKVEQLELKLDFLKSEYESKSEELNASNEENEKMVEMVAELRCGLETSEKNNKKYLDKMAQYQTSFQGKMEGFKEQRIQLENGILKYKQMVKE